MKRTRHKTSLHLSVTGNIGKRFIPTLRRGLRAAHKLLQPPLRELSLVIVGVKQMAALHEKFLGQSGPTDVLTFELDRDRRGRVIGGEVIVCLSVAADQSRHNGHSTRDELLLYALHGMLHLCGFDDRTKSGFAKMHAKEDQILTKLGVGPIFSRARAGAK